MDNPDPNHVKGSHPHAAAHAAKGIRYVVLSADTVTYATQHEARAAGPAGGELFHSQAIDEAAAPAPAEPPAS